MIVDSKRGGISHPVEILGKFYIYCNLRKMSVGADPLTFIDKSLGNNENFKVKRLKDVQLKRLLFFQ